MGSNLADWSQNFLPTFSWVALPIDLIICLSPDNYVAGRSSSGPINPCIAIYCLLYSPDISSERPLSKNYNVISSSLADWSLNFLPTFLMSSSSYRFNCLCISSPYVAGRSSSGPINLTDIYMTSLFYKYDSLFSSNTSFGCQEKEWIDFFSD